MGTVGCLHTSAGQCISAGLGQPGRWQGMQGSVPPGMATALSCPSQGWEQQGGGPGPAWLWSVMQVGSEGRAWAQMQLMSRGRRDHSQPRPTPQLIYSKFSWHWSSKTKNDHSSFPKAYCFSLYQQNKSKAPGYPGSACWYEMWHQLFLPMVSLGRQ